jgi:hypothetical protein
MKRRLCGLAAATAVVLFSLGNGAAPARANTLIHDYEFNNSYLDSLGGPGLSPDGGVLSSGGYSFGRGQGLSLSGALPSGSNYAIQVHFRFDLNGGWDKIIDPHNLGPDIGLYVSPDEHLNDYPHNVDGTYTFQSGVDATVLWQRDGATGQVTGFVNGVQQWQYTDTAGNAVFDGPSNIIWFFEDDATTGHAETTSGTVDQILIYDGPATAVPEPASLTLLGIGAAGLLGYGWRRRKLGKA